MSILPLSFAANLAISMNAVSMTIEDVVYETVAGIDRQAPQGQRTITGAVDTSGRRTLEQIFGGSVSDGDISILPEKGFELYFPDEFNILEPESRKQSFVTYAGHRYRVIADADYTAQAGCKMYLATRHVQQDAA